MNSQSSLISTLPPLSSPDLDRLRSRLEQGLLRLARLSAEEQEANTSQTAPVERFTKPVVEVLQEVANANTDRRAFPRRTGHCRVAVCRLSAEERSLTPQQIEWRLHSTLLKGSLDDLSLSGAAILLPNSLPIGDSVVLRLFCPRRDRHTDQQATIIRNQADDQGHCKVTCEFTKKLPLEQVSFFSRFLDNTKWI